MPLRDALRAAEEAGLDLVEISPNANPPVVKVINDTYDKDKKNSYVTGVEKHGMIQCVLRKS